MIPTTLTTSVQFEELMSRESLSLILQGVPDAPTQRMATVCATFFCWLGTNCGQAFLQTAQRAAQRADRDNKSQRLAWLFAWTGENIRKHQSSGGIRLLESILAEPKHRVTAQDWQATRDGIGHLKTLPLLSADDYEVIDALVMFLATGKGQHMLRLSLMALMRTIGAGGHVLDVGCGYGRNLRPMAAAGLRG